MVVVVVVGNELVEEVRGRGGGGGVEWRWRGEGWRGGGLNPKSW